MNRDDFVRILAKKTNFTIQDTRLLLNAIQEIFEDAIISQTPINIRGIGSLSFTKMKERKVLPNKVFPNGAVHPPTWRMTFSLALNLKHLLKNSKNSEKK